MSGGVTVHRIGERNHTGGKEPVPIRRRADWSPFELGRPDDEHRIESAIETSHTLAAALEPHPLDDRRIGIVTEDRTLAELRAAITA